MLSEIVFSLRQIENVVWKTCLLTWVLVAVLVVVASVTYIFSLLKMIYCGKTYASHVQANEVFS